MSAIAGVASATNAAHNAALNPSRATYPVSPSRALHSVPPAPFTPNSRAFSYLPRPSLPPAPFTPYFPRPSLPTSRALHPGPRVLFTPYLYTLYDFPRRMSMRKSLLFAGVSLAAAGVLVVSPAAQSPASSGYQMPPKVIADLMDAEPLPTVSVSPDRTRAAPGASPRACRRLAEVAAPFLGLAGARVNPEDERPARARRHHRPDAARRRHRHRSQARRCRRPARSSPRSRLMASTSASRTRPTAAFACWSPTSRRRRCACCSTAASTDSAAAARGRTTPPASSAA